MISFSPFAFSKQKIVLKIFFLFAGKKKRGLGMVGDLTDWPGPTVA
jgi:hypothetical protein